MSGKRRDKGVDPNEVYERWAFEVQGPQRRKADQIMDLIEMALTRQHSPELSAARMACRKLIEIQDGAFETMQEATGYTYARPVADGQLQLKTRRGSKV